MRKVIFAVGFGILLRLLSANGAASESAAPAALSVSPTLKFPSLEAYEQEIREPGAVFEEPAVCLYAPRSREREARIIFGYLVKAYGELRRIVGMPTWHKIVVYHLPEGNANGFGGTSLGECAIYYHYQNLDLASQEEWTRYQVPHLAGYIEEMAHNFVSASRAQFGWEMIGWSLAVNVTEKVAGNPAFRRTVSDTRTTRQAETYRRYRLAGNRFPDDVAPNLCDRIHAYLLWQCELLYQKRHRKPFWPDFFREIKTKQPELLAADRAGSDDERRNARYRITVECFDRLMRGGFRKMLKTNGISLTTDVQSLRPTDPGWNRRLE